MGSYFDLDIDSERAYPTPYSTSPWLPILLLSLASQKHSPETTTKFQNKYDYIVVGAGSAGSVVASRLSEIPCVTVLLLEAGKPPPRLTEIPAIGSSFYKTDIDWDYKTQPQKYTAAGHINRQVTWPSGKTLGGSSTLNGMFYVRGNRRNYDDWAQLGAKGWSYKDVFPYFLKLEDNMDPVLLASGYHVAGGPITASRPRYNPVEKRKEVEAVLNENYHFVDPNGREQIGFYDYQSTARRGQRCGTAKAYLVPAEYRPNLDIVSNAMVRKVLIKNKRAVGVEFDFQNLTRQVMAEKEVILSAGAVNTAQLLMLSGIGPQSELKKFNIPLVADLPVGMNFQDHPASAILYEIDSRIPTFDEQIENEWNIRDYIISRRGPLTNSDSCLLMAFLSNNENPYNLIPDSNIYFFGAPKRHLNPLYKPEVLQKYIAPLANKTLITCTSQLLHPLSRGTVSLKSADPYDPPLIDPNYYSNCRDIDDVVEGLKKCIKILSNPAMKSIGAKPINVVFPGCENFVGDEDLYLRCLVKSDVKSTSHLAGTARMGDPNDSTTVVDPQLRVKGVECLRVVDASVMPLVPWGNTNIPTIMVGEKASDIIKKTIKCY